MPHSPPRKARQIGSIQRSGVSGSLYSDIWDIFFTSLSREKFYKGIQEDSRLCVKLSGNWETLVGEQDVFIHILEYENYGGYDKTTQLIRTSEVCHFCCFDSYVITLFDSSFLPIQHLNNYRAMLPFLNSRSNQLNQEFAFLPTAPPHAEGGVFELRSYQLKPGTLLEWENAWSVTSLSPVRYLLTWGHNQGAGASKPVGNLLLLWVRGSLKLAVCIRCTTCGNIRTSISIYFIHSFSAKSYLIYSNMQTRRDMREKAWQNDGWAETVSKVSRDTCDVNVFGYLTWFIYRLPN